MGWMMGRLVETNELRDEVDAMVITTVRHCVRGMHSLMEGENG